MRKTVTSAGRRLEQLPIRLNKELFFLLITPALRSHSNDMYVFDIAAVLSRQLTLWQRVLPAQRFV
jgi:hypothetical protein